MDALPDAAAISAGGAASGAQSALPSPIKHERSEEEIIEEAMADVDPESVVQPLRELSVIERHQVFQEILYRFFESEYRFSGSAANSGAVIKINQVSETDSLAAAKSGWILLISRLLSRGKVEVGTPQYDTIQKAKEVLVTFILDKFKERMDLAILWLHEEYLKEATSPSHVQPQDSYAHWFHKLLIGLQLPRNAEGTFALDHKDRAFTRFLMDSPEINHQVVFDVLRAYCHEDERYVC